MDDGQNYDGESRVDVDGWWCICGILPGPWGGLMWWLW